MLVALVATASAFDSLVNKALAKKSIRNFQPLPKKQFTSLEASPEVLQGAERLSDAFVGGTVGVMSVMFLLELKKVQDTRLEGCPYCIGNGEILCALCCGNGIIGSNSNQCSCCNGRGLVICVNCKGDGRETPIILQSKAVRNPEYATDSIGIDSP